MIGNLTIEKPMYVFTQIGIILFIFLVTMMLSKIIRRHMNKKAAFEPGDKFFYRFISYLITGLVYFAGIVAVAYLIPSLRGRAAILLAGSGMLVIVVGFASEHAFSNIVGGIFIAIFKPFRIGDRINFLDKDIEGVVEDITLRHTTVHNFENKRIIVPNSLISRQTLVNESIVRSKTVKLFDICISRNSDVDRAMEIIKEEALNIPETIDNRNEKEKNDNANIVKVYVTGSDEESVNISAVIWTASPTDAYNLGHDLNLIIKELFDYEKIEIKLP